MDVNDPKAPNWLRIDVARWYDCMLGKFTDRELASRVGTTEKRITARRRQFGIEAYSITQAIAPFKHLLGAESDVSIAAKCGASVKSVRHYRRSLGIPTQHKAMPAPTPPLPKEHPLYRYKALLGRVPDEDVCRLSGVGFEDVANAREALGRHSVHLDDEPECVAVICDYHGPLLGYESLLGTIPDTKVSRQVGVPVAVVEARRIYLGIKRFKRVSRAAHYAYLLGLVPDSLLAELTGVSHTRIADMRKAMKRGAGKAD
ncbi:hypothetical protein [Pseudomonas putida]|nr:hypothetical protein [Pseudomonas putida]